MTTTVSDNPRPPRRRRRWLLIALGILALIVVILFPGWRKGTINGGQRPAEPFRIAGNLYYVGANDIAAFLIAGPQGHVLIDGGYPGTPPLIMASIARLGFNIRDVKVLLNSEPHYDHAGGLAELQRASGAELWASDASARAIESGGDSPDMILPLRAMVWTRLTRFPPAHVDHRVHDGDTVRLGPIALTAHITGGHTRGCTTWTFDVQDAGRTLHVVDACSLVSLGGMSYEGSPADFERTFKVLRSLPVDIWMTSHARLFGRSRKFLERGKTADSAAPFIDPEGYRQYIDSGEARLHREMAK